MFGFTAHWLVETSRSPLTSVVTALAAPGSAKTVAGPANTAMAETSARRLRRRINELAHFIRRPLLPKYVTLTRNRQGSPNHVDRLLTAIDKVMRCPIFD